jgi:predicted secreted hydrolase
MGEHGRGITRRRLLAWLGSTLVPAAVCPHVSAADMGSLRIDQPPPPLYPEVVPGRMLRFPHDHGSHPDFRIEWWYVTGWLQAPEAPALGFQVTFFRTRPEIDESNPSAFTPRQILIAHGALSDARRGRLLHDERIARAGFGLAGAELGRTHVWIDDWSLGQSGASYRARVAARDFTLDLSFTATQPPLLQGEDGYSRKGPLPELASYYYSIPHLAVRGRVEEPGRSYAVSGRAWLDHEWSSALMDERAMGWDWIGINLDDGAALMAFQMRDGKGGQFWAAGGYRSAAGVRRIFSPEEVEFVPVRHWRSPRTGTIYPVAWRVRVGELELRIEPLMDDQESDNRASVGTIYWEGAVYALTAGKRVGRGYLELTGYWRALRL